MNNIIKLSITAIIASTTLSMAEVVKDATASTMKQSINLGFSSTTGNTETSNLNGKYIMAYTTVGFGNEALAVAFDAASFMTKNNGVKNNEELSANLGLEQHIMNGWAGYASVNWLKNEFLNFNSKLSIGAGVSKELFNNGQHVIKIKLGASHNSETYTKTTNGMDDKSFIAINEYIEYTNKLNETSNLFVKLGSLQNFEDPKNDYEVLAVAGLSFSVSENISVSLEQELRYDSIPASKETTDTKSIVRVGYTF